MNDASGNRKTGMLTYIIAAVSIAKNTYMKFLYQNILIMTVLLVIPPYVMAATQRLPPSLPDADDVSLSTVSTPISMPEYVIIRSNEETTFSSETTGQVIFLPVKEGSAFNKGDVLLKLDCRLQEAELAKARAQQEATSKAMQSAKKLKGYGSISEFEYIKTKSEADAANADVQKLKVTVEKCTVIAPFAGGVADVKVNLYETVKPGDPLLKVVNTENLTFEVQVPSQWLSWLHINSRFSVHINDINKTISAKVTLINPEIEPISQTVKIVGLISPPNPLLRPGMTGQAIFDDNPNRYNKE
jgi:membrane fusion protein (multidrug efflux system)